jgi:hypothetical protein
MMKGPGSWRRVDIDYIVSMLDIWGDINPAFRGTRGILILGLVVLIIRCFHLKIVSLGSPSLLINITVNVSNVDLCRKGSVNSHQSCGFLYSSMKDRLEVLGRSKSLPNKHVIGNI